MDGFFANIHMYYFFRDIFFDTVAAADYRTETTGRKHTDSALYGKKPECTKETDKKTDFGKNAHSNTHELSYPVQCSTGSQFEIKRLACSLCA